MNPEATRMAEAQARLARFANTPFDANVDYLVFSAFSFFVARALIAGSHKESLILDSGATDHIFTERDHYVEYTPTVSTQRAFIATAESGTAARSSCNLSTRSTSLPLPAPSCRHHASSKEVG